MLFDRVKQYCPLLSNNIVVYNQTILYFCHTFHQFVRNFIAFNPHHTLFGAAIAEQVDAAVPNYFLVDNGKFLMDVCFENQVDAGVSICLVASFQAVKSLF